MRQKLEPQGTAALTTRQKLERHNARVQEQWQQTARGSTGHGAARTAPLVNDSQSMPTVNSLSAPGGPEQRSHSFELGPDEAEVDEYHRMPEHNQEEQDPSFRASSVMAPTWRMSDRVRI